MSISSHQMYKIEQRKRAIAWARQMCRMGFVVLDTETTGFHDGEVVSIAVLDYLGNILLDTLVKPVNPIPETATAIHSITDDMVKDAMGWQDVREMVFQAISGRDVCVYNAVYDLRILHQSSEHAGLSKIEWKMVSLWHCVMTQFAAFYGDYNGYRHDFYWQKLGTACAHIGYIPMNEAWHTALGDCRATLAIMNAMASADDNRSS